MTAQAIGSLHHLVSVGVRVGVLGQGLDAGAGPGVALVHGSAQSQRGCPTQHWQCVSPSSGNVMGRAGLQGARSTPETNVIGQNLDVAVEGLVPMSTTGGCRQYGLRPCQCRP